MHVYVIRVAQGGRKIESKRSRRVGYMRVALSTRRQLHEKKATASLGSCDELRRRTEGGARAQNGKFVRAVSANETQMEYALLDGHLAYERDIKQQTYFIIQHKQSNRE